MASVRVHMVILPELRKRTNQILLFYLQFLVSRPERKQSQQARAGNRPGRGLVIDSAIHGIRHRAIFR
jgi:hypothetical protein